MGKQNTAPKFKFSEGFIQEALSHFFAPNSVKYDIDGLYVFDWESDKLLETKSGLIYEFEIKISRADFKNDFKNKKDKHIILEGEEKYGDKYIPKYYEYLEESKTYGKVAEENFHKYNDDSPRYLVAGHKRPNFFYYAVPTGLIEAEEAPSYAGLVYVSEMGYISIIKKAPALHKEKYADEQLNLSEKFYYNMNTWKGRFEKEERSSKMWKEKFNEELEAKGHSMAYKEMEERCKSLEKTNSELNESMRKSEQALQRDLYYANILKRRLIHEVQKYNPQFNFWEFEKELL